VHSADRVREPDPSSALADRIRLDLALAAAGNVGVWDGDLAARLIYADIHFARIYGVDPVAAAAGQPTSHYFAYIHPDDRPAATAAMEDLLAGKTQEFFHEHRICRPDGAQRWVLARGRLLRDPSGRPIRLPGLSFDITERRQAEARQAFLLDLADSLRGLDNPDAILNLAASKLGAHLGVARAGYGEISPDLQSMVVRGGYAHGAPELRQTFRMEQFGQGNAQRLREGFTVVHADLLDDPHNHTETFHSLGSRGVISVPLMRDGAMRNTLWVSTLTPRAWTQAEIALVEDVAARLWDALERARAERALRHANAQLEQRVQAALAERDRVEEALRQSQKMEAVGQLTGGIAHDFNNMLQGIASAIQLMDRRIASGRPEEAARYVAAAQGGIERAAALTHRLLAFSRRQALAPTRIDVPSLIEGLLPMLRQTAGPAIDVQLALANPSWPVECDANQLENALLNLAINARDAMLPHGGRLTIETAEESFVAPTGPPSAATGDYLRFTIRDTGVGMTPDVLSHALEPFFTTKPAGQGTGLGLSQVYGFASQSKGAVRLESTPDEGTSVHLYLPRHLADVPAPAAGPTSASTLGTPHGATVLLVEDDAQIRAFLSEALDDLGFRVIVAENGPVGLDILRDTLADLHLLIADVGLPGGLNGRQLADAGRAFLPNLPVLLITGYAGDAITPGALPQGFSLLPKPFTLTALVDRLIAIFGQAPTPQPIS